MHSTGAKVTITSVASVAVLAQELPLPDWAQKGSLMACVGILAGLMLWVLPRMFDRIMEHGQKQIDANKELGQKIDNQTLRFVEAISDLKADLKK